MLKAGFYKMIRHRQNDDSFDKCLAELHKVFDGRDGQYEEVNGINLRLGNYRREAEQCTGEFIRQQTKDIPPFAKNGSPLQASKTPIGHRVAFLYHHRTNILVIESNRTGVSPAVVSKLIEKKLSHTGFEPSPVLNKDDVQDLLNGSIRKFIVKFAPPENLALAEVADNTAQNLINMSKLFSAPAIELTCGFDTATPGALNSGAVAKLFRALTRSQVSIRKLKAKQEGEEEMLDLLGKKLIFKKNVTLVDDDVDKHYQQRKKFLHDAFDAHKPYIVEYYAA